jgi:RNA polymerase sigma-70 factor (ECF subfamily)
MDGGHDSFQAAFDSCASRVLAFALRRTNSREDAEDITAETFAIAWRRREEMPDTPLPWLYAIAGNVLRNQRRSGRRMGRLRSKLAGQPREQGGDHAELIAENDAFAAAFATLTEAQREVLRLVAWEGVDSRDGAVALGCSEAAFKVRLHRARKELEKRLERAGHEEDEMPEPTLRSDAE